MSGHDWVGSQGDAPPDGHQMPRPDIEPEHTPTASEEGGSLDHCAECSAAAQEWISWPCSPEQVVKVAVTLDRMYAAEEGRTYAAGVAAAREAVEAVAEEWDLTVFPDELTANLMRLELRAALDALTTEGER